MENDFIVLFERYFKDKKYIVNDIIYTKKTKIIFILESPHNDEINDDEINNRCPVAGQSGIDMAKFINLGDRKKSLGKIAKEEPSLGINILNICRVPLQSTDKLDDIYKDKELVDKVDKIIRSGYKSFGKHNKKNNDFNVIEELILNDFRTRCEKIIVNADTLIVVCGEFAKVYFDRVKKSEWNVIYVPHPSRNQWNNNFAGLLELSKVSLKNANE